jgi:carboxypeptidase family protein
MIDKRKLFCSALLLLLPVLFFAQRPTQTLRGTITGAGNARPLIGATIVLPETSPGIGATTDEAGIYQMEEVPVGRYRMQVSYVGYETVTVAEVLVEAGKEAVLDVQLHERQESLREVVVKAAGKRGATPQALGTHTITVEEQFRFPATFYDPARLAMSFPGVAGVNDGTNIISVRGNSPASVRWRLEGVDIVNPNHTSNAGTFSDRPTQAGGGVTILSAQLLGASDFLSGNYPAEYGDALGGILDMRLRDGNNHRHEFTAQAGFLGLEAAAEGPLGSPQSSVRSPQMGRASYLVNYRYSFTGLLSALGADFGDEETAFQDVSFNLSLPTKKAGKFTLFGVGGKSKTIFRSPVDSALITEDKERFDIDFLSEMGALGLTHILPAGKNGVWRTVVAASGLEHRRTADFVESETVKTRWENDNYSESKVALSTAFSRKINARHRLNAGMYAVLQQMDFSSFFTANAGTTLFAGDVKGWLLQPYIDWHVVLSPKVDVSAGVHGNYFTFDAANPTLEPRLSLSFAPAAGKTFSLAYGLYSQTQLAQVYSAPLLPKHGLGFTKSHQLAAGYHQDLSNSLVFKAELYYQRLFQVPVASNPASTFSVLNLTEAFRIGDTKLNDDGKGRNYGLDLSLQKFILHQYYFLFTGSLYRSRYTAANGREYPTRFDGRYLLNLTGGREFSKQKGEKVRSKGINARIAWLGGFRASPVDVAASLDRGFTVYDERDPFSEKLQDYFRVDLRLYLKWNIAGRNGIFSLDIQNATNRENISYLYYDSVQGKIATKTQLGLIPILSYRVEF